MFIKKVLCEKNYVNFLPLDSIVLTLLDMEMSSSTPEQAERAKLREDYLRTLVSMTDKSVKIKMYEKVTLSAIFKAFDPDGHKLLVVDADIPMGGTLPSAMLRVSDIISVHFGPD